MAAGVSSRVVRRLIGLEGVVYGFDWLDVLLSFFGWDLGARNDGKPCLGARWGEPLATM